MFAVVFEVKPSERGRAAYLACAAHLRQFLVDRPGFISIERFQSLTDEGKLLSLSFWEDEASISEWRELVEHRAARHAGKASLFDWYRIRVAEVVRDHCHERAE
ncbi:antibiotic biosynthesis monooxygenase [Marichromatium purpuratum 984]|uniref:Antibiotic biosynthesis monooxygenase n=1 Tax=Marichromatium purpuratum 984 TaxID=765910 RepID=W0E016_MARPU|nr:antibiotic biosynthesis monooxygenase [Marichromatium purpuratum]AHF04047.1 antibiotic biosynthesis monooxygenase [Marichromatium purpuratum 984]